MRGVSAVVGVSRVTCEQRGAGGGAHRGGGVEGAQPHRGGGQPGHVARGTWHQCAIHCTCQCWGSWRWGGQTRRGPPSPGHQPAAAPRWAPPPAPPPAPPCHLVASFVSTRRYYHIVIITPPGEAGLGCCRGSLLIGKRNDFNKMTLRQKVCELIKIKLCGVLGADSGLCLQAGE